MPKLKSHSGAAKRFRKTGSGKFRRNKEGKSHLLTGKKQGRKRNLRSSTLVHSTNQKAVQRALPYL